MDNEKNSLKFYQYTKNMFTEALGDKYARNFHEIYYADFQERDQLMKELYEEARNDTTLKSYQSTIIKKCYVAYLAAIGANCNFSIPLVSYINKKHPNLSKIVKNDIRLKRIAEDLQEITDKSGFSFNVYSFPYLLDIFLVQFNQHDKMSESIEYIILAALGKYTRVLPIIALPNIWYSLMFMKNIASLSYIKKEEYENTPQLKQQVTAIIKTIYVIDALELKRLGKSIKNKETTQADNNEASEPIEDKEPSHDI